MKFRGRRERERVVPAHMLGMTTPQLPRDFEILREVGHIVETCAYGTEHKVTYIEHRYVSPTGETREYDNGYTKDQTPLVADRNGRIYHSHPPTDFYGGTTYIRDGDRARFTSRTPTGAVRLLSGQGIAKAPDGPAWSELQNPTLDDHGAAEKALRDLGVDPTPERIAELLAMKDGDQT